MKKLILFCFVALLCVSCVRARSLLVGEHDGRLLWQGKADYIGIPLIKRVKEQFYADPGQQVIKGIIVKELETTGATAVITAGGVGFSYVNVQFESERGGPINYILEVYV